MLMFARYVSTLPKTNRRALPHPPYPLIADFRVRLRRVSRLGAGNDGDIGVTLPDDVDTAPLADTCESSSIPALSCWLWDALCEAFFRDRRTESASSIPFSAWVSPSFGSRLELTVDIAWLLSRMLNWELGRAARFRVPFKAGGDTGFRKVAISSSLRWLCVSVSLISSLSPSTAFLSPDLSTPSLSRLVSSCFSRSSGGAAFHDFVAEAAAGLAELWVLRDAVTASLRSDIDGSELEDPAALGPGEPGFAVVLSSLTGRGAASCARESSLSQTRSCDTSSRSTPQSGSGCRPLWILLAADVGMAMDGYFTSWDWQPAGEHSSSRFAVGPRWLGVAWQDLSRDPW